VVLKVPEFYLEMGPDELGLHTAEEKLNNSFTSEETKPSFDPLQETRLPRAPRRRFMSVPFEKPGKKERRIRQKLSELKRR